MQNEGERILDQVGASSSSSLQESWDHPRWHSASQSLAEIGQKRELVIKTTYAQSRTGNHSEGERLVKVPSRTRNSNVTGSESDRQQLGLRTSWKGTSENSEFERIGKVPQRTLRFSMSSAARHSWKRGQERSGASHQLAFQSRCLGISLGRSSQELIPFE